MVRRTKKNSTVKKTKKSLGDMRQVFNLLNEITGKTFKKCEIPNVVVDGKPISDPIAIVNSFNAYFLTDGTRLAVKTPHVKFVIPFVSLSHSMYLFNS